MSMNKILHCLCLYFLFTITSEAQTFTNSNYLTGANHYSGVAIGVADMNADGLDDIVRLDQGYLLNVVYQQAQNDTFTRVDFLNMDSQSQWMLAVGDVDNNGYNDVMSGDYNTSKIAIANEDGTAFTLTEFPGAQF